MAEDICPICNRAKASGSSGSITQWIVACQCELKGASDNDVDPIQLCRTCGKRMDEGRRGSITQFIFRSDSCRCKIPASLAEALKESERLIPAQASRESAREEQELEVSKDGFPIERYKPLVQLGAGASGMVFLARDRMLNKKVAIKILRVMDRQAVISFQEEARTTNRLKHKYIVDLLDFGVTSEGSPYMVLEYIVGSSLAETISREGSLKLPDFFSVFRRVCEALSYAHRNGVFHRDLKPGNILLTSDSDGAFEIRIIDFGLSKILNESRERNKDQGVTLAGTPLYMSPDQGLGRKFDVRSEIYSLGCVMFETLTGSAPFESEGALELLALHAEQQPPSLTDAVAASGGAPKKFPMELEELIQVCLAKNPDKRYQSMDDLLEALKIAESAVSDEPLKESDGISETMSVTPSKRSGKWVIAGFTLTALLVTGFTYYVCTRMNEPQYKPQIEPINREAWQVRPQFSESVKSLRTLVNPNSEVVNINGGLSDDELKELRLYTRAREIDISNNLISDEAISYISSPRLQVLRVNNTNVGSLKYISRLKSLRRLDVGGSSVNGEALKMLTSLPNLDELDIRNTEIKDEDLYLLRELKTLSKVDYQDDDFSLAALNKICKEMPGCRFGQRLVQLPFKNLGRMISTNKYKESLPAINESIAIIAAAQGKDAPLLSNYYFYQGLSLYKQDKIDEAKKSFERSLEISKQTGYTHSLDDVKSYMRAIENRDQTTGSKI